MPKAKAKLHFLGIAGATMSGVALAASKLGYDVSGTDRGAYPPVSDWLDQHKITWWREPDAAHIEGVDKVIISGGTPADDVELVAAQARGIPIVSYAEFVGELAANKRRIVVAGTHGKTTTTSLVAWLLESAGRKPDFVVGIQPKNFDSSVRLSDSPVVVLEGDEYKASSVDTTSKFMYYKPDVLIATSLEMDHPDLFKDVADIRGRFEELIRGIPKFGSLMYWPGAPELAEAAKAALCNVSTYGENGDWHAGNVQFSPQGVSFEVYKGAEHQGHFAVPLYGKHNVDNATAAIAVALGEGISADEIQQGLATFRGAARRFSIVSAPGAKITVVDDYAHHPSEIATTIEAVKLHFGARVVAVVRPHTYSRVSQLLEEYRKAVAMADQSFVAEIEGAREAGSAPTVSSKDIAESAGGHVVFEPDRSKLVTDVVSEAKPGDVVLCMTVGGYDGLAAELADKLQ